VRARQEALTQLAALEGKNGGSKHDNVASADGMNVEAVSGAEAERRHRVAMLESVLEGFVKPGTYIIIELRNVPRAAMDTVITRARAGIAIIASGLLPHEQRTSVVHFNVQRTKTFDAPLKAKTEMIFQCGFRRFRGRPTFSEQSRNCDKHKSQRFLHPGGWSVASVYAPITYSPASVLVFTKDQQLAMVGTLLSVDPDRVSLKRIILTGIPAKIHKKVAVVTQMFHRPEDIRWFKPVELRTKYGMVGNIKDSVGTHGSMKCTFNKPIKNHDTVCMYLYKRTYPKWVEQ
jgi:pre-rRNA-processing protein TSR1